MDLNTYWVKYGLLLAAVSIVIALISFYLFPMGIWTQFGLSLLIYVGFMVMAAKDQREKNGGIINFGDAFKTVFFTGLVGSIISILFTLIWMNLIDNSLPEKLAEMAMDSTRDMLEKFGADENTIAEAIEKAEEEMEGKFTPFNYILQGFQGILMGLIPSAIIALIMKKEETIA